MPHNNWEYVEETVKYRIAYYGTGMSPMFKYFDDKEEAEAEFKKMAEDPFQGVSELTETKSLMRRVYR